MCKNIVHLWFNIKELLKKKKKDYIKYPKILGPVVQS